MKTGRTDVVYNYDILSALNIYYRAENFTYTETFIHSQYQYIGQVLYIVQ